LCPVVQTNPIRWPVIPAQAGIQFAKQTQFAECPNECKPKSNKELPQAAPAPTPPNQTQFQTGGIEEKREVSLRELEFAG